MSTSAKRLVDTRLAQFSLLCSNLIFLLPGTALAALALVLAVQNTLTPGFRIMWFFVLAVFLATRVVFLRHWIKEPATEHNVQSRLHIATVLTCGTACCFGVFGYLAISPESPLTSLLVIMVLTGMVASSTAATSHLLPMYLLFVIPLMTPVGLRLLSCEEPSMIWLGGLVFLYLVVCIGSSRSIRGSILRSIQLRFENIELLEDLKHQHQRAEASLAREEKANLAKSNFLAAASHDLRQPMHSLRLFTATLEMQTRNTQHKTLVGQIDSSVKSLEELFNALLDISKLDAGTVNAEHQHIFLDNLLSQIESEYKPMAVQKQLDFSIQLDGYVVHTDVILLERLIRNLVDNAIRYTEKGSVHVTAEVDQGRVWVSVSDTGVGIPTADQNSIYDEFVQLSNAERDRNQGIGLGLSIVKRLADLMDVQVLLDSQVDRGSTFRVGIVEGDVAKCRFSNITIDQTTDHISSLFILVVDDEEEVCLAVEGLLETWGCVVMCATSGDTALQQLREIGDVPDLIISDYRLRDGETGGDVIARVRQELGFDLPAIVLSGDIAPDRLQQINALGFPLVHKPCEPQALRQLIVRETATREPVIGETSIGQTAIGQTINDEPTVGDTAIGEAATNDTSNQTEQWMRSVM